MVERTAAVEFATSSLTPRQPEKKQSSTADKRAIRELKTESAREAAPKKMLSVQKLFVLDTNVLMHDPMCLNMTFFFLR